MEESERTFTWAVSGNLVGLGCPRSGRWARKGGPGQVTKGKVEEHVSFKGAGVLPQRQLSAVSAEASALESAAALVLPDPIVSRIEASLPLSSGRQKAVTICLPPTNILGGRDVFFAQSPGREP